MSLQGAKRGARKVGGAGPRVVHKHSLRIPEGTPGPDGVPDPAWGD